MVITHNNPQFLSQNQESILQYSIQNKLPLMKAAKKIFDKKAKPKSPAGNAMTPLSTEAYKKEDAEMGADIDSDAETVDYGEIYPAPQRPGADPPHGGKKKVKKPNIGKTQRKFQRKFKKGMKDDKEDDDKPDLPDPPGGLRRGRLVGQSSARARESSACGASSTPRGTS